MTAARTAGITCLLALGLLLPAPHAPAFAADPACSLTPGKDWLTCHESCPDRPIADALACIRSCLERLVQCREELRAYGVNPGPVDAAAKAAFIRYHAKAQLCGQEQLQQEQCEIKACGERPPFLATEESRTARSKWQDCVDKSKCADKVSLVCRELSGW